MLVEAGVLDGDDRLLEQRVDPVDAHDDAVLGVEGREPAAVGGQQDGLLGQRRGLEDVGDVLVAVGRGARREADGADERQRQPATRTPAMTLTSTNSTIRETAAPTRYMPTRVRDDGLETASPKPWPM